MIVKASSEHNMDGSVASIHAKDDFFEVPEDESSVIQFYSRSFSMASRCLPKDVRRDVEKLYAWCRWCDEAVDSAPNSEVAEARLSYLREDINRIFDGNVVQHPASNWLAELVESKGIQKVEALALLTGMEMDLRSWQVRDQEELIHYCYHVAGVVGLMMCRVMGVRDRAAIKHAADLGIAMQLTNIARDVAEDWRIGRSYLPKCWIDLGFPKNRVPPSNTSNIDCSKAPTNESVRVSVERLLLLAEGYYKSGLAGLPYLPNSCRPAICLAAKVYREIGREILRRSSRVMDGRITISPFRLAWVACEARIGTLIHSLAFRSFGSNFVHKFSWRAAARKLLLEPVALADRRPKKSASASGLSKWTRFIVDCRSPKYSLNSVFGDVAMNDARYLAYLGLSLTSFMASALFVMVTVHPKDPSYATLPIVYAAGCVAIGVVTNVLAVRAGRQPVRIPVSPEMRNAANQVARL